MLPKDKSTTPSSKSSTASRPGGLDTPVQFVKGVGPRLAAIFNNREIKTIRDLLTFFPRAYEDRTRLLAIQELTEGQKASVAVRILSSRKIPMRQSGRFFFETRCTDGTDGKDTLSLKWFHLPRGLETRLTPNVQVIVTGVVKFFMNQREIVHPEITWKPGTDVASVGRIVPVYIEIEGVPTRVLRKILWEALEKYSRLLSEDLPLHYRGQHQLPLLSEAVRTIHFPPESTSSEMNIHGVDQLVAFNTPAHWRLIYEEFFKFEYLVLRQRLHMEREAATAFHVSTDSNATKDLTHSLPFRLTLDQKKAVEEILADLSQPHPMNRLIQGDVGCGKTAVAFLAAGTVLAEGGQAALMAPTEILAEQHYTNASHIFGKKLNTVLLTGKTPSAERTQIQLRLESGEPLLLIGTHALIEQPVQFKDLAFIIIDEQHRFGVEQRRTLRKKGTRLDPSSGRILHPHMLIMSATPIPRTLALTAYGDLSISTIHEMPPGRSPVKTRVFWGSAKNEAYEKIRQELKKGHQAYFIYPLIHESEAEGFTHLKSAIQEANRLAQEVFPEFKVGLLHGQLKPDEKASIMNQFKKNELQVLVSTTVVEVGVDVPNATMMAVEHAERFGLSQLHQLRGRVGRGTVQSHCFLFAHAHTGEVTTQRLNVLEETSDGFQIAEADLELRGPGEFLGVRQSGSLPFKLANLVRDQAWLLKARNDVQDLLRKDPDLNAPEHLPLRRYYEREGSLQFERLKTS